MSETLLTVLCRWIRQGKTDDQETPLNDYGKRVVHEVIRILSNYEIEKPVTADLNRKHLMRLKNLMWDKVGHYSNELDEYASTLFERPIRGSWRILTLMVLHGQAHEGPGNPWYWEDFLTGNPRYPASEWVTFEFFASVFLHEVAHGWRYQLLDYELLEKWYAGFEGMPPKETHINWRRGEEEVCWEVSRFVCKLLSVEFDETAIPKTAGS
jgi:hypothetical protein